MEISITSDMWGRATRWKSEVTDLWIVVGPAGSTQHVFRDKCAHMGSPIRPTASGFMCDTHGWSYRPNGSNEVDSNPGLEPVKFSQSGRLLVVRVSEREEILPRLPERLDGTEKLELLAHACFALSVGNSRVLFDPWLTGDAYWGSWRHFPKVKVPQDSLAGVTSVVVTHPHPDHFHPETLALLPRTMPIFFPNFPSQIIQKVLHRMGFTELHSPEWESVIDLGDGVSFTFLRPTSVWEDSSVLVRVKNWVWLNQNDAESPLRDELLPDRVDLFSSAFDVGATGYPLTWQMSPKKADRILANARRQTLESIGVRCRQTGARFFSPFAGWWRHTRPEHQEFARRIPNISMGDVREVVEHGSTEFLETLPGSEIVLKSMKLKVSNIAKRGLNEAWEVSVPYELAPPLSRDELVRGLQMKLGDLATMSAAVDCEKVEFTVHVEGTDIGVRQEFGPVHDDLVTKINVRLSPEIASLYISGDETVTWNHLYIGYWGRWSREPDIYPVRFMRLLALGYVSEMQTPRPLSHSHEALLDTSIGTIVERNPELATALLSRAGLPCISCSYLKDETLRDALVIHSVPQERGDQLKSEVQALLGSSNSVPG